MKAEEDLGQSARVMMVGTLLSRLTGFGRVAALAYALGFFRLADTYTLANNTPTLLYELVLGGVLAGTLVPVFLAELRKGDEGWRGISAIWTVAVVVLLGLTALFFVVAPLLIRLYTLNTPADTAADQLAVATTLLRLFAPQVVFYGLISLTTGLLNARRRFGPPMFAPILNNVVVIGVLLALPSVADDIRLGAIRHDSGALLFLGLGTTAGVAAMCAAQLIPLLRSGTGLRWYWAPRHPAVRAVARLSGWTVGYVAANQVALIAIQALANSRSGGVIAYQAAFFNFFVLPHGVIAVSIITALQPDLADAWQDGSVDRFRERLATGLRTIVAVLVPAAAGYIALAGPIVSLLLERGELTPEGAALTADSLALMAVGLPAFSAYLLVVRAFQQMQDARTPFLVNLAENALNIVLGIALFVALGVPGLGLAMALAYAGGLFVILLTMRARLGSLGARALGVHAAKVVALSALTGAAAYAVSAAIGGDSGARLLARVLGGVVAGVSVYLGGTRAMGITELGTLFKLGRRRGPA